MAELIPPRRDESLTANGVPTLRFSEYLEGLARDVNLVTNEISITESAVSEVSIQNALIAGLARRVDDLEASNDTEVLNSRIAQVSAKVTRLIDELIEEVKKLQNTELENKSLCVQEGIKKELELLNERTEEGLETGINEDDIE